METLFKLPEVWLVIGIALLLCLIAVGYYFIQKARSDAYSREILADSDVLTSVNDLYDQGDLSDEEFKRIKGMLSNRLHEQARRPPPAKPQSPSTPQITPVQEPPS